MEAKKFIGKVLPDGHLSLPIEEAMKTGKVFEVILLSVKETDIYNYTKGLIKEKKIPPLTEKNIEKIIHESRGIK